MNNGFAWFMMAVLVVAADVLQWRSRRKEQLGWLAQWADYDRSSERRHQDFMRALDTLPTKKAPTP